MPEHVTTATKPELVDEITVVAELRAAVRKAGGMRAWGEAHGVSRSYVRDVLNADRGPGESVLRALGYGRVTRYVKLRRAGGAA